MGQGSISVFSVMAKYMKSKQNGPGDFARYVKDFNALRMNYRRFMGGNPAQILDVMDTCLFIKGYDQNFFKERLPTTGARWTRSIKTFLLTQLIVSV